MISNKIGGKLGVADRLASLSFSIKGVYKDYCARYLIHSINYTFTTFHVFSYFAKPSRLIHKVSHEDELQSTRPSVLTRNVHQSHIRVSHVVENLPGW